MNRGKNPPPLIPLQISSLTKLTDDLVKLEMVNDPFIVHNLRERAKNSDIYVPATHFSFPHQRLATDRTAYNALTLDVCRRHLDLYQSLSATASVHCLDHGKVSPRRRRETTSTSLCHRRQLLQGHVQQKAKPICTHQRRVWSRKDGSHQVDPSVSRRDRWKCWWS